MSIQVSRYGGPLGTFTDEEIREGLRTGRFHATDLGLAEGMTEAQPLAQFPQFAATAPEAAVPPPVQPVVGTLGETSTSTSRIPGEAVAESGLPWENRANRGFFEAFFQTVIMVLTKPAEAFDRMRKEGGLMDPLIYAFIGGTAGAIVSFLFSFALNTLGMAADRHSAMGALMGVGVGAIFGIILMPIFVVVGTFIGAAVLHVCLMIVGGAKRPFETTFRVLCFSSGSTNLLMMVPFCGGIIAGIWGLVVNCIGLARAHQTDTWRAVVAIFLPMVVCCGGVILFAILFGTMGLLSGLGHH